MRIVMLVDAARTRGVLRAGHEYEVSDRTGADLCKAGLAKELATRVERAVAAPQRPQRRS